MIQAMNPRFTELERSLAIWKGSFKSLCLLSPVAFGLSRGKALAPGGMKKESFLPQIASSGGFDLRKYS